MKLSRRLLSVVLLVVLGTAPSAFADGLDILLTNDDGWDSVGIQALKDALTDAGHNVTLVAPLTNRSGSSAAVTLDLITVIQQSANEYAVDGTPVTSVFLALPGILTEPPDLVVSGTNDGANLGPVTVFSGTVGATIASLTLGVPAIALSTDPPTEDPGDPAYATHFAQVADFAVDLIGRLQANADAKGLLPERTALNVNYPPLPPEEIAGVKMAVQGQASSLSLEYQKILEDPPVSFFIPALGSPAPGQVEVKDGDTALYAQGYITVVPIDGNYTASRPAFTFVKNSIFGDDDEGDVAE